MCDVCAFPPFLYVSCSRQTPPTPQPCSLALALGAAQVKAELSFLHGPLCGVPRGHVAVAGRAQARPLALHLHFCRGGVIKYGRANPPRSISIWQLHTQPKPNMFGHSVWRPRTERTAGQQCATEKKNL
eukprot:scaffold22239_cov125-Isochrysis_galbana.AAC.3